MARPDLSPRDRALYRLDAAHLPGWRPGLISRAQPNLPIDPRDAALAEALYVGSVKMLLPLRWRISHHAGKPLKAIDDLVQKILVLAAWQLTGMDNIPAAIAVDQAVEQCRRFGRPRAAGLVNAVLRNFGRQPPPAVPETLPLPERLELTTGLSRALGSALLSEHGSELALAIAAHANFTPPTLLRLYSGVTPDHLRAAFEGEPSPPTFTPHHRPGTVVAAHARREHFRILAEKGLAQVQDATASAVLDLAELTPGQTVLDRCAGSGTKTLHLQDLVGDRGVVHAVEPDSARCQRLADLCRIRNLANVHIHRASTVREAGLVTHDGFDRVLLDVPCSNSGVLARRPEARFHAVPPAPSSPTPAVAPAGGLLRLQSDLLDDTAASVRVGGLLIYSTCSIWRSENAGQIRAFLDRDRRFVLKVDRLTLPAPAKGPFDAAHYHDGGYVAVLVRDR